MKHLCFICVVQSLHNLTSPSVGTSGRMGETAHRPSPRPGRRPSQRLQDSAPRLSGDSLTAVLGKLCCMFCSTGMKNVFVVWKQIFQYIHQNKIPPLRTLIFRPVQFSDIHKQSFTHKLPALQGNTALNAEIGHHCSDSWFYHLKYMNQGKCIPNRHITIYG